jgi:hypothetical protein
LGIPTDLIASATIQTRWRDTRVRRYGRSDTVQITVQIIEVSCLCTDRFAAKPCGSAITCRELVTVTTAVTGCRW